MTVVAERDNDEDEKTKDVQAVPSLGQSVDVDVQAEDCG